MIVGFGGGGGFGITQPQRESLKGLLRRMSIEAAVHRGITGRETMIHDAIRVVYPLIPVHVVPITGKHSTIASMPLSNFPQTIIYQAAESGIVTKAIMDSIDGLIFLPEWETETGELVTAARERDTPVVLIWPDGKVTLEGNQL